MHVSGWGVFVWGFEVVFLSCVCACRCRGWCSLSVCVCVWHVDLFTGDRAAARFRGIRRSGARSGAALRAERRRGNHDPDVSWSKEQALVCLSNKSVIDGKPLKITADSRLFFSYCCGQIVESFSQLYVRKEGEEITTQMCAEAKNRP